VDQQTLRGQVGEYRIYESIAAGGFASVYYGRDTATNVPVAVKRLHPHLQAEPGIVERFEQEAATVRGLTNPHIVRLLDQGRDLYQVPFIVMEWVEGLTVADWLKRQGRYSSRAAAEVGAQALEGLDAAWARRVVHRDIKPANLMVTPGGQLKIMDFGVAKDVELAPLAGASGLIGTPAYMAPEQLRGQPLDCRADLYSLGVTLYMMLAGRPPFEGPSFADYFRQHLEQEPPRIEDLSDDVDPGLADVLRNALAKNPNERYATPAEMLAALRPYAEGVAPVNAVPAGPEATIVVPPKLDASAPTVAKPLTPASPLTPAPPPTPAPPLTPASPPTPAPPLTPAPPPPTPVPPLSSPSPSPRTPPRWPVIGGIVVLIGALILGGSFLLGRQGNGAPPLSTPAPTEPSAAAVVRKPSAVLRAASPPAAVPGVAASPAPAQALSAPGWHVIGEDSALFNEPVGVGFDPQGTLYVSNNGSHSVDKLDSSGNLVARWGGPDNGEPQFRNPGGIATDDKGDVYIADTGNNRILHLSSAGAVVREVGGQGNAPGQFDAPTAVAVDGAHNVYVADSANHRIQKLGPEGRVLATWGTFGSGPGNFNYPYGVDLDQQGNVYVADRNNNRVVKLSRQGAPLATWPTDSNGASALSNPSTVAVDSSGNVFVAGWASDRVQRVQKLSPTGALVTSWTIDGKNEAQLSLPYQIDFDAHGDLHVAVVGADRVEEFSPDGKSVGALGTTRDALGVFRRPNNIGIDSHDRVYVTDWGNERVQRLAATPTQDPSQGPAQWGPFTDLQGVATDGQGNIFLTESADCRVRKLSPAGDTLGQLGSCGAGRGEFQDPQGIAVDADGNVYVADRLNYRIVKLSPSLEVVNAFGAHGSGDGQFDQPNGVALDAQGNVFVADRNNNRIVKLSPAGQFLATWGNQNNPALHLSYPQAVAVDAQGNIYVADWGSSRVLKLSSNGELLAELGTPGTGVGHFYAPEGLAIDSQGHLYVADTGNNRVQELTP
jgi:serine/threonine protein kinase/sugar lactone lactonase YvrE